MPPATKKKTKRGKSKKYTALDPPPCLQVKALLKAYIAAVQADNIFTSQAIEDDLKQAVEQNKWISKFILSGYTPNRPISLCHLIKALRAVCYMKIREIYSWRTPVTDSDIVELALLLETPAWKNVSTIELVDGRLSEFGLARLSRTLPVGRLKKLVLDYNSIKDEGMANLLVCLSGNTELTHLSLNYCQLSLESGELLAELLTKSAILHLEVTGNSLECDGAATLVNTITTQDIALKTLLLADNGIDAHDKGKDRGPYLCAKIIRRWLTCTQYLEMCDLRDNQIGDLAAREIMDGLMDRKTAGLKSIQFLVTCRMDASIYKTIQTLGKKSGKGSGKKKKRKKK